MELVWVCAGGAFGSGARYLVSVGAARWLGAEWPYGTLFVNLLGSFLLGTLLEGFLEATSGSPGLRLALTTGAMGGFTTYSTFNYEALTLLEGGRYLAGGVYLGTTVLGCLLFGALGIALARGFAA